MRITRYDSADAPSAVGGYAQAVGVAGATRLLFISGQVPETPDGACPDGFEAQARLVWGNVQHQLAAAGLTLDHLVKVTTFLASRDHRDANSRIRQDVLGDRRPALTVIIADIYDPAWHLEIEAIAAV